MSFAIRDSLYISEDPEESTFKYDNAIPPLPVPTLEESVAKILVSVKPLAEDNAQYDAVCRKADKFLQDPRILKSHNEMVEMSKKSRNWLESWWLEYAYLRSRKPLIPYSNMAAPMPITKHWPIISPTNIVEINTCRIKRAAMSLYFQLSFWKLLLSECMRPMIHKNVPWTMNQFRYLFNAARIPHKDIDQVKTMFESSASGMLSKRPFTHIIVLHRGYIFSIDSVVVPTDANPKQVCIRPAPQIAKQLEYIENWCKSRPLGPGVGALTTQERSEWADARDHLRSLSAKNARICDKIESAISVLVLDDNIPTTTDEIYRHSVCGDPANRWADKSIQSLAFRNGTFGASAEHTNFDGFCSGVMTNYVSMSLRACEGVWNDSLAEEVWERQMADVKSAVPMPELLEFDLDSKLLKQIGESKSSFVESCNSIESIHGEFTHYGKEIMKEHRLHPEAFVQCAIHSTYFKLHNKPASAYVTASTRRFINGRTETCRSCYSEMYDFARAMSRPETSDKQRYELLKTSVDRFQTLMQEASFGKGCDRHLLVLYLLAMRQSGSDTLVELFEDPLFQQSNYFILSTSCSGYWNVCGGVPPIVDNGYGCFYSIEDNLMVFCCTAYKNSETNLPAFHSNLTQVLLEMHKLLVSQQKNKL